MKIINIIPSQIGGGAELLVNELHKMFLTEGLDTHVIYFTNHLHNIKNTHSLGHNPKSLKNILALRKIIKKIIEKNNNDNVIVHSHLTWGLLFTYIATMGMNIKHIYTEHNTHNRRRNIPLFWIIERILYKRLDKIICISAATKQSLEKWLRIKDDSLISTIHNGSRFGKFQIRNFNKEKFDFISVGSLSKKKNFSTAIRTIAKCKNIVSSYKIFGEGPERGNLQTLINELGLSNIVQLEGWSDDIQHHIDNADIQLIPSLWEGFGLVALEGLSAGLPIVASDAPGLNEVLRGPNLPVRLVKNSLSDEEFEEAIVNLLATIKTTGTQAYQEPVLSLLNNFTLEKMADNYIKCYQNSLDNH